MAPDEVAVALQEIAAALKRRPEWRLRLRLMALDLAFSGKTEEAAATAHVQEKTVRNWLDMIRRAGIEQALSKWECRARPRKLVADAMALQEEALKQKNPRIRKRILALACVADGMSVDDAAVHAGLNRSVIYTWIERFQKEGMVALLDVSTLGRPRLGRP